MCRCTYLFLWRAGCEHFSAHRWWKRTQVTISEFRAIVKVCMKLWGRRGEWFLLLIERVWGGVFWPRSRLSTRLGRVLQAEVRHQFATSAPPQSGRRLPDTGLSSYIRKTAFGKQCQSRSSLCGSLSESWFQLSPPPGGWAHTPWGSKSSTFIRTSCKGEEQWS